MAELSLLLIVLAAVGMCAGILAGLLGVGGGIVIVPALYFAFGWLGYPEEVRTHLAIGTSLATIIATSVSSIRSHYKKQAVDVDLLKRWGAWIVAGCFVGAGLASLVSGDILKLLFAAMAVMVALKMGLAKKQIVYRTSLPYGLLGRFIPTMIGGLSTMIGIGGGSFTVPVLVGCGREMRQAVGTAAAVGLVISLPGTIGFLLSGIGKTSDVEWAIGYVSLVGFIGIVPTSMLMAPVGAKLAHWMNPDYLRRIFALFLLVVAGKIFFDALA